MSDHIPGHPDWLNQHIKLTTHHFIGFCVLSHSVMSDSLQPMDCSPPGSSVHGDSPGQNTGVCCHALLQGIRDQTQVPHIAGRFFTIYATREAPKGFWPELNQLVYVKCFGL